MSESDMEEVRCSECNAVLSEGVDREITGDGVFCRSCFMNLAAQIQHVVAQQGEQIDYRKALFGGVLGGAAGILVWWGVTLMTGWAIGIVAVVIGFAVGKGVLVFSGNKRSRNLQIMAAVISTLSFFYASYLVTRSFVLKAYAGQGEEFALPLLPDPVLFVNVIAAGFRFFDLIFLAIVVYQAWKMPAPIRLGGPAAANE